MATLQQLRQRLIQDASITSSENLVFSQLERIISAAITQHNPAYTVSSLPAEEEEAVLLLAWSAVCYRRAAAFAQERDAKGSNGFEHESNTPYRKNIDLAEKLLKRYEIVVSGMGLARSAKGIVVGTILAKENDFGSLTPLGQANVPMLSLALTVTPEVSPITSAVMSWSPVSEDLNDYEVLIFTRTGTDPIFQNWNAESDSGIPRIADGTTLLATVSDMAIKSLKVTDMNRAVANRFIAVARNRSLKYTYSNEVAVAASP